MVQWIRVHLPMQGAHVQSLFRELGSHVLQGNQVLAPQLEKAQAPQRRPSTAKKKKKKMEPAFTGGRERDREQTAVVTSDARYSISTLRAVLAQRREGPLSLEELENVSNTEYSTLAGF